METSAQLRRPEPADVPEHAPAAVRSPARFSRVFDDHAARVARSLRRLGVAAAEVDDAVQEVFLVVWRRWSDLRADVPVTAWVYGISRRVALARARRARRTLQGRVALHPGLLADHSPGPRRVEDRDALRELLKTLDDDARRLWLLYYAEGLTMREIAARFGIPMSTGYSRLEATRRRLARAAAVQAGEPARRGA